MARSVVLVDSDLDALGSLASQLRSRGLTVLVADDWQKAKQRVLATSVDAVVVARGLAHDAELDISCLEIDGADPERSVGRDPDEIARRLLALPIRREPALAEREDFRGDLGQVGIVDLLQLLGMNRRTGQLSVTTARGSGEIRLVQGDVVDAAHRRLEGGKALIRLLGERDGTFAFTTTPPSSLRRIDQPLNNLVMEGLRQLDELARKRPEVCADGDALLATREPESEPSELGRTVLAAVQAPRSLDELLDDVAAPDLEVMVEVLRLIEVGAIRRIPSGAERTRFADVEHASLIGAMLGRLAHPAFGGRARLVLAGHVADLAAAMHALGRFAEAISPAEDVPAAPVPHTLATLHLAESAALEVVGLPLLDAFAPLWSLSLAGAVAVVPLAEPPAVLEQACAATGVPILRCSALVDPADPAHLGQALREALDAVSGRK
ncbi:MAG: DUF4388 domain-containing protein [Polyangiaceae bacterium]|nr:DUF4388 domain-containing protein [Polyangiaceae bacterium]